MKQSSGDTAYLSSVTVSCDTGYSFKQEEYYQKSTVSFLCEKGGKWDKPRYPTCQVVYCGAPEAISFGFVKNYSGSVMYNSRAVYECYNGFTMQGTPEVTCSTSGKWQTLPSCESVTCGAAPPVENAELNVINKADAASYGAIVEYTCKTGYEIMGSSRRLCNATNEWTSTAPTCEKKKCALPKIAMGSLNVAKPAEFEDKVTLTCQTGYWASTTNKTTAVLTCKEDGTFEEVSCVDEDECVIKSPCLATQTCMNTVGSYKCVCRPGYRPGTTVQCEDINECSDGNGGCQHNCLNSPAGSYTCTCKDGYKLFENGTNFKYIVEGETGLRRHDVYRLNHSCVRNTCPRPSDVTNGVIHSMKQTFVYEDEIMYSCKLGFSLSGNETRTCQASGNWSGSDPTCTATTCSAQTAQGTKDQKERVVQIVPTTPVAFKGKVVIECRKEDNSTFNKTLYCAYDSKTKTYTLQGDSPICPVVDCGPVEAIAGFNKSDAEKTGSAFGAQFEFSCSTGATLSGVSTENSTTVKCLENGRWGFGNLTCKAAKCPDPGTPGGTNQIFDSYEQGKVVAYRCTRPGFTPVPHDNRTCVYSDTNTSASWSGSVPVCEDTTPPAFTNCDGDRNITIFKMQVPNITIPSVQDNSGFLSMEGFILPRGFSPADPVWKNTEVTYEATDGAGLSSQCKFQINVREMESMTLDCPDITYNVTSTTPATYNISDHISHSSGALTSAPTITAGLTNVGTFNDYRVTLRSDQGFEKTCAFQVLIKAGKCFHELTNTPRNASITRSSNNDSSILSTVVTCSSGYAFADGSTSRTYNCSGENLWSPSLPLEDCLPFSTTEYTYKVSLDLKSNGLVEEDSACRSDITKLYNDVISPTTSGINNLCQIQGQLNAKYRFSVAQAIFVGGPSLFDHKVELTLKLENNDGQNAALVLCAQLINLQKRVLFGLVAGGCNFTVQDSSTGVNLTRSGQSCGVGNRLRDVGGSKKCLPCPHGYSSSPSGGCLECPDGQYQDQSGQASCKSCGDNMYSLTPRSSRARCVSKCRPGFFSATGQQPCDECQEDTYWVNATHCLPCPDGSSTLYVQGTTSISACRAPCPTGQYSVTGYYPCTRCPLHFYQDFTGESQCTECPTDQITDQIGSTNRSACKPGNTRICSEACSDAGTDNCTYIFHRLVCTCKQGYTGDKCETEIDYCMSNPCLNGATCKPKLGGFDCQCTAARECKMNQTDDYNPGAKFIGSLPTSSESRCFNECISNSSCVAMALFTDDNLCIFLNEEQAGNKSLEGPTERYYEKKCKTKPYFSGKYCQTDLGDDCTSNNCSDYSVCRDLIGGHKCVCPSGGQYTQPRCDSNNNPCSDDPCKNGGTCNSWGEVRYQCTCHPGFTGVNCETEVDECKENPSGCLYGGTCVNGANSYSCTCKPGFGGDHCHNEAVLCTSGRCNNGLCISNYDNITADCICEDPFEKAPNGECTEKDFCSPSPCNTNNTERCDKLTGDYRCVCKSGYEGSLCQHNIDDCASKPCVHGTCVDRVTTFSCRCDDGWTGALCESDMVDCTDQCHQEQTERCVDLNQDYRCECKPGYTGRNCTELINECDSLPCMHGGTCVDLLADYSCNCTPGWEGKNCQNIANTCSGITCQNDATCYSVFEDYFCSCKKGTQGRLCENAPNVCDLVKPCTTQGTCQQSGGSATCNCTSLYSGVSCELITDTCSANVCSNGGNCSLVQPMGHSCDCPQGFSGDTCQTKDDVCRNKCPSGTTCLSEGRETFCLCKPPNILSGRTCKDTSPDFDLYLDNRFGSQFVQSHSPFQLTGDMSIMFWIGYLNSGRSVVISNLDRSDKYFELFQDRIHFCAAGKVVNVTLSKADLETVKGQWDHVAATWTKNGSINVFINGIKVASEDIDVNLTNSQGLKIVWFDPAFKGYISRLTVWRGILTHTDVSNVLGNLNYQPPGDLALGWSRYKMAGASRIYVPSKAGPDVKLCEAGRVIAENCTGQPDKRKPALENCPTSDIVRNINSRVVEALTVYTAPFTVTNATVSSTFTDELMMRGSYDIVYVATDGEGNTGWCRFKVYITGSSTCSTDGFLATTPCGATAVRDFCPTGQAPSIPTPNILSCGKLGSYNLDNPLELYTPPACGATSDQKYSVDFTLIYQMTLKCTDFLKSGLLRELKSKFVKTLSNRWPGLCVDVCTNLEALGRCDAMKIVVNATLTNLRDKISKYDASITLSPDEVIKITAIESDDLNDQTFRDIGQSMLQKDQVMVALKTSCDEAVGTSSCVACGPGSFFNSTLGQCELCPIGTYSDAPSQTSCKTCGVKTTLRPGARTQANCVDKCPAGQYFKGSSCSPCPRDYYQEKEGQAFCYPCPVLKRTRVNGTDSAAKCFNGCPSGTDLQDDGSCKDCAQGYFRTRNLQDSCEKCPSGKTTEGTKTTSSSGCNLPECPPGNYINGSNICTKCPVGQFQPRPLQRECTECPTGYSTQHEGSMNATNCKAFCAAGQQVNGTQCEPCPRGTWNDGSSQMRFSVCEACSDANFTTESTGATSATNCTLRNCPPGYKIGNSTCEPCGFGEYQPLRAMSKCESCGPDRNTSLTASTSRDQCTIYCGPGKQGSSGDCDLCPEDTFKNQSGFSVCTQCEGNVTSPVARTLCNVTFCDRGVGYNVTERTCYVCQKGYYKDNRGNTPCTPCSKNYTTFGTYTQEASGCDELNCEPGYFAHQTATCTPCPTGYYKGAVGTQNCTKCDAGMTTQGEGSTASAACSLKLCPAGEYRTADNACQKCAVGEYQNNTGQTQCSKCETGFTTLSTGSSKTTDCLRTCAAGQYLNVTSRLCIPCPLGTYLPTAGTTQQCRQCPTGSTTTLTGSTDESNCSLVECEPGYRRTQDNGCQPCGRGFYQSLAGKTSCIKCDEGRTTFLSVTSATENNQCIRVCLEGTNYNPVHDSCDNCSIGQIRDPRKSDFCYFCPPGTTTVAPGSKTCIPYPGTTPAPTRVTVTVDVIFEVNDCRNFILIQATILAQIDVLIRARNDEFPGFCEDSSCSNIRVSITAGCTGTRRKRQTVQKVTAQVTAANLPEKLSDKNQTVSRSPESLLVQALTDNAPALTKLGVTYASISAAKISCAAGFVNASNVCEPCPAGTRHDSSTGTCRGCGIGEYQDQTGQTSCKTCTGALSTLSTHSVNVTDCLSKCKLETGYCKNNGICRDETDGSVTCDCSEYYTGDTCTVRRSVESQLPDVITGVCVGIFVLLLGGLATGYYCYRRSRRRVERERHSAMDKISTVHDYNRSPYTVYRGYSQFQSPVFNEVYDFYRADDTFPDQ